MTSFAEALCGSGVIMECTGERLLMEKKSIFTEEILGKRSMTAISVWTDWYILTGHLIPGFWNTGNVHRPARVVTFRQETGELCLKNYMNHLDLKDYINLIFEVTCDGKILKKGRNGTEGVHTARADRKHFSGYSGSGTGKMLPENILYYLKQGNALVVPGGVLGFDEILLKNKDGRNQQAVCILENRREDQASVQVTGNGSVPYYRKREVYISLQ